MRPESGPKPASLFVTAVISVTVKLIRIGSGKLPEGSGTDFSNLYLSGNSFRQLSLPVFFPTTDACRLKAQQKLRLKERLPVGGKSLAQSSSCPVQYPGQGPADQNQHRRQQTAERPV